MQTETQKLTAILRLMKRVVFISLLSACLSVGAAAQQSKAYEAASTEFSEAKRLYDAGMYGASRTAFINFAHKWSDNCKDLTSDARYYHAVSAKMLGNDDAVSIMQTFLEDYPQSTHRHDMLYHLGDKLLIDGKESKALKAFAQASPDMVQNELRSDLIFKTGYCYFMRGQKKLALAQFDKLRSNPGKYQGAVKYYKAHVDYERGNLNAALKSFMELDKDPGFSNVAPYYIAHIFYLQKHFTEAIRYAEPLVKLGSKKAIDMQRIVADSHFMLAEYDKSIAAYGKLQGMARELNRADHYHLGIAHYNVRNYSEAAASLSKVTQERDDLAQNAYYHLADSYLKLGDKKRARVAFEAAAKSDFDMAIKEDAHFNKLKLAYELNFAPFNEIVSEFLAFIELYPNSDKVDEAYDYVGKAFVTSKNYKKALETMEKIKHKNLKIYTAMQRLAFYRGLELYTSMEFENAMEFFDYSLRYADYDSKLKARAYYWKGECLYRLGKVPESFEYYNMFVNSYGASELSEFANAYYNMGYVSFNGKKYDDAKRWYVKYTSIERNNPRLLADAYNRLGDCLYVTRNFAHAIENYDKSMSASADFADYAMLQKGICLGLVEDNRLKIEQLQKLVSQYPESQYCDNAYYEIARAYVSLEQIKEAIYNFKVVKEKYPKGSLASKAMLQLGLLYYNNGEYDNSMAFYKRVINEYKSTPEASDALDGLRNVYIDMGDFDGYVAYTATLGSFAKMETYERDSLMYTTAQRQFMRGNIDQAKAAYNKYLDAFADGRFTIDANYYLGECYYQEGDDNNALTAYLFVVESPRSIFTEDALQRSGELLYKTERYSEAIGVFRRLETEAELQTNKTEAIIGQMRCHQKLGDVDLCIESAAHVIDMPQATPEILREAKYIKSKALMEAGRSSEAMPLLRELSLNTKSAEGAEAKYQIAQIFYNSGDLDNAEKEVFDYIEKGTPHQYWLARSFVLLSDIYHDRNDDFQAQQYLESLRENYNADDDIDDMIDVRFEQWRFGSSSLPDDTDTTEYADTAAVVY